MNRQQRRAIEKKNHFKAEPLKQINAGYCHYCKGIVWTGQGQAFTTLNGNPMHGECRKLSTQ